MGVRRELRQERRENRLVNRNERKVARQDKREARIVGRTSATEARANYKVEKKLAQSYAAASNPEAFVEQQNQKNMKILDAVNTGLNGVAGIIGGGALNEGINSVNSLFGGKRKEEEAEAQKQSKMIQTVSIIGGGVLVLLLGAVAIFKKK